MNVLAINNKVFETWDQLGVKYCHWKSNEHLEEGLSGQTDMDILVCEDDKANCERGMLENGYRRFTSQKGTTYPHVEEWLGYDTEQGKMTYIHLHYRIITGTSYNKEFCFPWHQMVLEERVFDSDYQTYTASPEMELVILYTRIVLKSADQNHIVVSKDYQKEIEYLMARMTEEKLHRACQKMLPKSGNELTAFILKDEKNSAAWAQIAVALHQDVDAFRTRSKGNVRLRMNYFAKLYKFRNKLKTKLETPLITRKIYRKPGISVCFIGADGAGKSTVSADVKKFISWKIDCMSFYLGSGDNYNSISKKLIHKAYKVKPSEVNAEHKPAKTESEGKTEAEKKRGVKQFAKFAFHVFRASECVRVAKRAYKMLKKADTYTKKGGIAIFDRFPQLQYEGIYDGPKVSYYSPQYYNNALIKFFAAREKHYIEKAVEYQPTLVIKLLLPPEESIKRKPDHNYEEVARKAEITKNLRFKKSEVIDIDATMQYEDEIKFIKSIIWEHIVK